MMGIDESMSEKTANNVSHKAQVWFQKLIQPDAYVGELYSINYKTASVQIHDKQLKDVGGIPSLSCFR